MIRGIKMSAIISSDVQMKEILKATGYDCPEGMLGKTFSEVATSVFYMFKLTGSYYTDYVIISSNAIKSVTFYHQG